MARYGHDITNTSTLNMTQHMVMCWTVTVAAAMFAGTRVFAILTTRVLQHDTPGTCATPMHVARSRYDITRLVEAGNNIDAADCTCYTALHMAVIRRDSNLVMAFLQHGAKVTPDGCGVETALHRAVRDGDMLIIGMLLRGDTVVDAPDRHGITPLYIAVTQDKPAIANLLIMAGADVSRGRNVELLARMAHDRNFAMVRRLLLAGADVGILTDGSMSALHMSVLAGMFDIALDILIHGGDVDTALRGTCVVPRSVAINHNDTDVVVMLRFRKAPGNLCDTAVAATRLGGHGEL